MFGIEHPGKAAGVKEQMNGWGSFERKVEMALRHHTSSGKQHLSLSLSKISGLETKYHLFLQLLNLPSSQMEGLPQCPVSAFRSKCSFLQPRVLKVMVLKAMASLGVTERDIL